MILLRRLPRDQSVYFPSSIKALYGARPLFRVHWDRPGAGSRTGRFESLECRLATFADVLRLAVHPSDWGLSSLKTGILWLLLPDPGKEASALATLHS